MQLEGSRPTENQGLSTQTIGMPWDAPRGSLSAISLNTSTEDDIGVQLWEMTKTILRERGISDMEDDQKQSMQEDVSVGDWASSRVCIESHA